MMEFLSKVTILHCTECNSTKKRLRYRFFLECLERFNKDGTLQYTAAKNSKTQLTLDLSVEALKILMCLQENVLGGAFFSVML